MTARTVIADVLLGAAVLVVLGSSVGVLVMRDVYAKLHYVTPVALLAPLLVGLAILAQSGWSVNRAARMRESGGWSSAPDDPGPENQ
jgi:multisubunit Na+/H+ antiporter MnhG subunit